MNDQIKFNVLLPQSYRKHRYYPFYEYRMMRNKARYARGRASCVDDSIVRLVRDGLPIHRIEIETINRCNGFCSFCPVSVGHDVRPKAYMADALFRKIMDELRAMNYSMGLFLNLNNEPLLDPHLMERYAVARQSCPGAYFVLYTNGTMLTPRLYHALMRYLDCLVIDNYNDELTILPAIRAALEDADQDEADRTILSMRYLNDVLDTRGGFSPSRKHKRTMPISCTNPFSEVAVTSNGDVALCCQDAYIRYPMGNLNQNTLLEIWHGGKFEAVRSKILQQPKQRSWLPICSACDFFREDPDPEKDLAHVMSETVKMAGLEGLAKQGEAVRIG